MRPQAILSVMPPDMYAQALVMAPWIASSFVAADTVRHWLRPLYSMQTSQVASLSEKLWNTTNKMTPISSMAPTSPARLIVVCPRSRSHPKRQGAGLSGCAWRQDSVGCRTRQRVG
jgi:hypothetical protein